MFSANINYIDLLQSWEQKDYINNQLQEDVSNQETKQNQVLLYSNPLLVTCLENLENNNWTFSSKFCHSAQQTASSFSARCSHFSCEKSKESHRHYMYPTLETNKQRNKLENNNWIIFSKFCHSAQQTASSFSVRCSHFSCEESKESHRHLVHVLLFCKAQPLLL